MSTYWLKSEHFMKDGKKLPYRPFGHYHTIKIADEQAEVIELLKECIAESSALDRLSSLASAYYILLGIFSGLTKAIRIGPCTGEDWPYLPLALAWTLPAIYKRVSGGRMVVKDPRDRLKDMHVVVHDLKFHEGHKRSARVAQIMIILFILNSNSLDVSTSFLFYPSNRIRLPRQISHNIVFYLDIQ
ncbi:hypothetical protein C1646_718381 [Rhizophagus diaphanus]|nr:hypothetical protein C1646_718381 [Rhizophagus diaphanus] [Rhizophagus sp. MUCL 43196]